MLTGLRFAPGKSFRRAQGLPCPFPCPGPASLLLFCFGGFFGVFCFFFLFVLFRRSMEEEEVNAMALWLHRWYQTIHCKTDTPNVVSVGQCQLLLHIC